MHKISSGNIKKVLYALINISIVGWNQQRKLYSSYYAVIAHNVPKMGKKIKTLFHHTCTLIHTNYINPEINKQNKSTHRERVAVIYE